LENGGGGHIITISILGIASTAVIKIHYEDFSESIFISFQNKEQKKVVKE